MSNQHKLDVKIFPSQQLIAYNWSVMAMGVVLNRGGSWEVVK
jgi:hypothetical protein